MGANVKTQKLTPKKSHPQSLGLKIFQKRLYFIRRAMIVLYSQDTQILSQGTTTKLSDCFDSPKNLYLNQATQNISCPIFLLKQIPGSNFKPQKLLQSSLSLEIIWNKMTPNQLCFIIVCYLIIQSSPASPESVGTCNLSLPLIHCLRKTSGWLRFKVHWQGTQMVLLQRGRQLTSLMAKPSSHSTQVSSTNSEQLLGSSKNEEKM